ncbi:hypothetical protein B0H13DRAFT_1941417 [Mycena leptocephala]|nr:hypothetical protein B0H13DRAFT_1941417 [Mycena leptocephala]
MLGRLALTRAAFPQGDQLEPRLEPEWHWKAGTALLAAITILGLLVTSVITAAAFAPPSDVSKVVATGAVFVGSGLILDVYFLARFAHLVHFKKQTQDSCQLPHSHAVEPFLFFSLVALLPVAAIYGSPFFISNTKEVYRASPRTFYTLILVLSVTFNLHIAVLGVWWVVCGTLTDRTAASVRLRWIMRRTLRGLRFVL